MAPSIAAIARKRRSAAIRKQSPTAAPPQPTMKAFYIKLTGEARSGTRPRLRLEMDWADDAWEDFAEKKMTGALVVGQ